MRRQFCQYSEVTTALLLVNWVLYSEGYRATLRGTGLFPVLVASLTSPSLTVVSNATGTLACLAEGNMQDQAALLALGALPALQVLYSLHSYLLQSLSEFLPKHHIVCRP